MSLNILFVCHSNVNGNPCSVQVLLLCYSLHPVICFLLFILLFFCFLLFLYIHCVCFGTHKFATLLIQLNIHPFCLMIFPWLKIKGSHICINILYLINVRRANNQFLSPYASDYDYDYIWQIRLNIS